MAAVILVAAPLASQKRLVDAEVARLTKLGFSVDRRFETADWKTLSEEVCAAGLFTQRRILIVEDASTLGTMPEDWLKRIEKEEQTDTVVLLLYEKVTAKDLGAKGFGLCKIVKPEPAPFWPSRRAQWLVKLASQQGVNLATDAASLMVEWIEEEEELRSQLEKFSLHGEKRVTVETVRALCANEGHRLMLNLLDALADVDGSAAALAFDGLRTTPFIPVLSAVHKRVRAAWYTSLWGSKTAASVLGLSDYQARTAADTAKKFSSSILVLLLGEVLRLSLTERSGDGEGWNGLERVLLGALSATGAERIKKGPQAMA